MRATALLTVVALSLSLAAGGAVVDVDHDGGGDHTTIRAGIDAAGEGDTVIVWPGTYSGPENRGLDPHGTNMILCCRDGPGTVTIDCEWQDRAFYVHSFEDSSTAIEGFAVTRGRGDYGGAILCYRASPRLLHLTICQNVAVQDGGGIYLDHSSSAVRDVAFVENGAGDEGGGLAQYAGSPTFTRCGFKGNTGRSGGGAIYCDAGSPVFEECEFWSNRSGFGYGGAGFSETGSPLFRRCLFHRNTAVESGGAFYMEDAEPTFVGCTFYENESKEGGAFKLVLCYATFEECAFTGNSASVEGGALTLDWAGSTLLDGCLVERNVSPVGAGIRVEDASLTAVGCHFADNVGAVVAGCLSCWTDAEVTLDGCTFSGNDGGFRAGAIYAVDDVVVQVTRCTFSENSAIMGAGIVLGGNAAATVSNTIVAFSSDGEAVLCEGGGSALLTCCDVFGNAGGDWVGSIAPQYGIDGNVCEDPLFCGNEDPECPYALHSDSCCATENNPECGLVGAWDVGCGVSLVRPVTWSALKARFR